MPPQPDGEERWIEALATVVLEDGQPVRMVGTCRDVTERVTLHRELRARASHQEAIARLGERALTESDLQKFFDEAVATIAKMLDVELVKILELVPGDAELLLRSGVGWNEGLVGTAYVSTGRDTQAGFTLASGGPVIVENLAEPKRASPARRCCATTHAVSGISTPIAGRDGRAYGVLTVHTRDAAQVQRIRGVVPVLARRRDRGRHRAPAAGSPPGADDPRAAPPLGQPVTRSCSRCSRRPPRTRRTSPT